MLAELLKQSLDLENPGVQVALADLGVQVALAVGTWALVLISLYFMRKSANHIAESNRIIKEANELSKVELRARLRPELEFLQLKASLETGGGNYTMRVIGTMKNTGTIPALNVRSAFAETSHKYPRDIVDQRVNQGIFTKGLSYGSLSPGSETDLFFSMDWNQTKQQSILAVFLEYEYENIERHHGEKLFVCTVSGGGTATIEQYHQSEIEEKKAELKKTQQS